MIFGTDLYLRFLGKTPSSDSDETQEEEPKPEERKRQPVLAELLYQLYRSALTLGKEDTLNLTTVVDMMKLSGALLEEDEKEFEEDKKQLQNLMDAILLMSKVSFWQSKQGAVFLIKKLAYNILIYTFVYNIRFHAE